MVSNVNRIDTLEMIFPKRKVSKKSVEKLNLKKDDGEPAYSILLNKTFSVNIVNYAYDLYTNIIDLKDSSKELEYFINDYKTVEDKIANADDEKKQRVNQMFEDRIDDFIQNYNSALQFSKKQKHSQSLLTFSYELDDIQHEYSPVLKSMDISGDQSLVKPFDLTNIKNNKQDITEKLEAIKSLANEIYTCTQNILDKPMSEHMNFRDLNYYYNYKFDRYESNTFVLIETGMIINLAL